MGLIKKLEPRKDWVHVSIMRWAFYRKFDYNFTNPQDVESIQAVFETFEEKPNGGATLIHRALEDARERIFNNENGARNDVPKTIVIITDGLCSISRCDVRLDEQRYLLEKANIRVKAIGLKGGDIEIEKLNDTINRITWTDNDAWLINDFEDLGPVIEDVSECTSSYTN